MSSKKEVIYIDTDDDITAVIDKATSSKAGILALVLPKRYSTLKSSVNMKLLKKTTDKAKKKLVLITEDDALLPLAGSTGIFVASSLKSRPAVPKFEKPGDDVSVISEEDDIDPEATVGELSGDKKSKKDAKNKKKQSTASSEKSSKIKSIKESSKIRVPNFDRFRLRMVLAGLGIILLAIGWYFAFYVMPKATVVIQAQTSRVETEVTFTIDPKLETDNIESNIVTGEVQEVSKTVTERFEATGEKNVGEKATGIVTIENCYTSEEVAVPAGTTFTDQVTGFKFTSDAAVVVPAAFFAGGCAAPGTVDVDVTAVDSGDTRNLSPRGYSISDLPSQITGFGGSMSGGTSKIVTVITEDDVQKATKLLLATTDEDVKAELAALFSEGTIIIDETFKTTKSKPASSQKAGAEASEASVSAQFTYSITGVSQETMVMILEQKQGELVDTTTQSILDSGVSEAATSLKEEKDGKFIIDVSTTGYVGPEIVVEQLAQEIAGLGFSEAIDLIKSKPGVGSVDLELTPFWVFSVPDPEKTTITIEISDDTPQ